MLFNETSLAGAFIITLEPVYDERGFFARSFCKKELEEHCLHTDFVQCNISYNQKKGTVRGLHYQIPPYEEVKIVSCRKGTIFDVIVDIRPHSPTFGKWACVELSAKNNQALYVPKGIAHGFQTLTDEVEVFYLMGHYYYSESARGIRWDDSTLNILWPHKDIIISDRDRNFPGFAS